MASINCYLCSCRAIKSTFDFQFYCTVYCIICGYYEITKNAISAIHYNGVSIESKKAISEQVKVFNELNIADTAFIYFREGVLKIIQKYKF